MVIYRCCDVEVNTEAIGALEEIGKHIHFHRLGTDGAWPCQSCLESAQKKVDELERGLAERREEG